jgi:hypothetical protein
VPERVPLAMDPARSSRRRAWPGVSIWVRSA